MTKEHMTGLLTKISRKTGIPGEKVLSHLSSSDSSDAFLGFNDVVVQINRTVKAIKEHPLISPAEVEIVGYIYDVSTGQLLKLQ